MPRRAPALPNAPASAEPDEKTGEAVRLFVAKAAGGRSLRLTSSRIAGANCRLTRYPRKCGSSSALPKSNVGKILRKDLRALP